jgi:Ca2+-binding RTX toxin-like protein
MRIFDQQALSVVAAVPAPGRLTLMTVGGAETLLATGGSAARVAGYRLESGGQIGAATSVSGSPQGAVTAIEVVELGASRLVFTSQLGTSAITASRVMENGSWAEARVTSLGASWQGVDIADLAQVTLGGQVYLLAISVRQQAVIAFRVAEDGALEQGDSLGAAGGLGLAAPADIEIVRLGGVEHAVIAGAGSSSISVVVLGAGGTMALGDHVIDSLETRFQGVQALASATLGDRVFLFAGGGDDGISAFTLLPGGYLLLLGTVEQGVDGALENITALDALARDDRIEVIAAGEGVGLTRLRFDPGALAPMLMGGALADRLTGDARGDLIDGGAGNDTLEGGAGADILMDGTGRDRLTGGAEADWFVMARDGAADTITDFERGIDLLDLSAWGRIYSMDALDLVSTATGAVIRFGSETLTILSADGRPLAARDFRSDMFALTHAGGTAVAPGRRIEGTTGNDTQQGGAGDDVLAGSPGADRMEGGAGFDFADYSEARGSQRVDLLAPHLNTNLAAGDEHVGIEGIIGGAGPDNLRGTTGDNVLRGGGNVDWLYGRRGNDLLEGGVGDDVLLGGLGMDTLDGGANRDRAQYSEALEGLTADLQFTQNSTGEAAGDVFVFIEDLAGSSHDDRLFGDAGGNRLFGRDGADLLVGRNGADYLNGGSGRDTLDGGAGDDTLRGGTQADVFVFRGGRDLIEEFRRTDGDRLELDGSIFGPGWEVADLVTTFARVSGGSVSFDFGFDNVVTLQGVSSLSDLNGLVWIV